MTPDEFRREIRTNRATGRKVIVLSGFNGDPYSFMTTQFGEKIDFLSRNGIDVTVLTPEIPLFFLEESGESVGDGMYDRSSALGADERFSVDAIEPFSTSGLEALIESFKSRIIELQASARKKDSLRQFYTFAVYNPSEKSLTGVLLASREIAPVMHSEIEISAYHYASHIGRCLNCDIRDYEKRATNDTESRLVSSNKNYIAFQPFAPSDPLEIHILPFQHTPRLTELPEEQVRDLAMIIYDSVARIKAVAREKRRLFDVVDIALHSAPTNVGNLVSPNTRYARIENIYHFHVEISPGQKPLPGSSYDVPFSGWTVEAGRPKDIAYKLRHALDPKPKTPSTPEIEQKETRKFPILYV